MVSCERVTDRTAEEERYLDELKLKSCNNFDSIDHFMNDVNEQEKCKHGRQIECTDLVRYMNFYFDNAIKYLENLKKYIQDEINERLKNG